MDQRPDPPDVVFVGIVESLGPAPTEWSGAFGAYQEVHYRVEATICGPAVGPQVVVRHAVVQDSPTAQPGDAPGLSSSLFARGSRLVVLAVRHAVGALFAPSEHFGALPYSRRLEEQMREASRSSAICATVGLKPPFPSRSN